MVKRGRRMHGGEGIWLLKEAKMSSAVDTNICVCYHFPSLLPLNTLPKIPF
jgi:hypothetical protein